MREVLTEIERWRTQGRSVALATIVTTWGSAPRPAGSKMAVNERGEMAGSVSGGCVEAAVVEEALGVLGSGRPRKVHFGVSDETAWEVGLACGGEIDLFVEPLAPLLAAQGESPAVFDRLVRALSEERPAVRAVVIEGEADLLGTSWLVDSDGRGSGSMPAAVAEAVEPQARALLGQVAPRVIHAPAGLTGLTVFLDVLPSAARLVVVGGVHIAIALARLARALGYHVTIVEPRRAFGTRARFPDADALVNLWPDEALQSIGMTHSTAVAVLSHDPKLDDPALRVALPSPAFYVGALGSKRTQELRRARLRESGLSEAHIARLHGPIGLDLGGREPEEIALSILAEIVAVRSGRQAVPEP